MLLLRQGDKHGRDYSGQCRGCHLACRVLRVSTRGYRRYLWQASQDAHFPVDFIGTLNDATNVTFNANHEGHRAWRTDNLAGNVTEWLQRGHGSPEAGVNRAPVHLGSRELLGEHFEPFRTVNLPLFPFGFGLSYTTFEYGEPQLSAPEVKTAGTVEVSLTVKNSGQVAGDEIVQLYLHQKVASVTRPVRELKGFQRISLAPGESRLVHFRITPDMLALYNVDLRRVVEPGEFEIIIGPSSDAGKSALLRVVE